MGAASGSAAQRETPSHRRKLVAIVYADMAGYSRLISHDDQGTLDRLRGLRRELIDPPSRNTLEGSCKLAATRCSWSLTASMVLCAVQ